MFNIGFWLLILGIGFIFASFLPVRKSPLSPEHGGFGYTDENGVTHKLDSCKSVDKDGNIFITPCPGQKDINLNKDLNLNDVNIQAGDKSVTIKAADSGE